MWLKWSWWSRMLIVEVPLILRLRGKKRFPCLLTGVNVMSLSPPDASQGSAKALIKFIRTSWPIALCSAKLTVGNVSILKNETVVVTCSVSTGLIESRPPMLFNQTLNDLATTGWYARNIHWLSEVTISFFYHLWYACGKGMVLLYNTLHRLLSCTRGQYLTATIFLVSTQLLRVLEAAYHQERSLVHGIKMKIFSHFSVSRVF